MIEKKESILYIQLPLLDNDTQHTRENFLFAGAYLDHALQKSSEASFYEGSFAPSEWDDLDTDHLVEAILRSGASVIVSTLYLWNVERTLRLAQLLKERDPTLRWIAGGPEVATDHPLIFNESVFDAIVVGEGEAIFPRLLSAWRTGKEISYTNLAIQMEQGWEWGRQPPPDVDLVAAQPSEDIIMQCVQHRPVVYLETVRGCPLTCSYCRYYQLHSGLRFLSTDQVMQRLRRFRTLGATEIRFVDPTFNARPGFTQFLKQLVELNADHYFSFFAEVRPDTLSLEQAELMKQAHFVAVEVGVQSIGSEVLNNVNRPTRLDSTAAGIRRLDRAGVQVVLDIMYGLPGQTLLEVKESLEWSLAFGKSVQVQCMQTLILPGTVLRTEQEKWGFQYEFFPPYSIQQTDCLAPEEIQEIECFLDEHPDLPADPVTPRFCGKRLRGLFRAQYRISVEALDLPVPGQENRRVLLFVGADLMEHREKIGQLIDQAIRDEPDGLWQFVLVPAGEEPLDLLEFLTQRIQQHPTHLLDRFASASAFGLRVSRRLYVRTNASISEGWSLAAEELLREYFG